MKLLRLAAVFAAALLITPPAAAQDYPSRPLRVIVPYPPGQGTDVATRLVAEHLARALGQPVVVDNRAGAGGNLGAAEAARAAPDGYTLLMGSNATHVLNPHLYPLLSFDADRDFEPVMLVSALPMVLLTTTASPFTGLAELLAAARARPDALDVALSSTTAVLVLELLKQQRATGLSGIRYQGSNAALAGLLGGQVALAIDTVSASRPLIAAGKLRPLGVTSLRETALLPGVKPLAAQGLAGFDVVAWIGLFAPRGTPAPVLHKLEAELARILTQPEVRQRLLELGHEPVGASAARLAAFVRSERQRWGPLIARTGIKAD